MNKINLLMECIRDHAVFLNPALILKQKLTSVKYDALIESHQLKNVIFTMAKNTENIETLKMLAKIFDELEFEQQRLWGFPLDPNHHYFWDFPKCTCPKIDNMDSLGTPYRVHSGGCLIHGEDVIARSKAIYGDASVFADTSKSRKRDAKGRFTKK
jgi:hypothetical protein